MANGFNKTYRSAKFFRDDSNRPKINYEKVVKDPPSVFFNVERVVSGTTVQVATMVLPVCLN